MPTTLAWQDLKDSLDQKFSRYLLWIIGVQVTIFLAIIATFLR